MRAAGSVHDCFEEDFLSMKRRLAALHRIQLEAAAQQWRDESRLELRTFQIAH